MGRGSFTLLENQKLKLSVPPLQGPRGSPIAPRSPGEVQEFHQHGGRQGLGRTVGTDSRCLWEAARLPLPRRTHLTPCSQAATPLGWGWGTGPKMGLSENLHVLLGEGGSSPPVTGQACLPRALREAHPSGRLCACPQRFELLGLLCLNIVLCYYFLTLLGTWCTCHFVPSMSIGHLPVSSTALPLTLQNIFSSCCCFLIVKRYKEIFIKWRETTPSPPI